MKCKTELMKKPAFLAVEWRDFRKRYSVMLQEAGMYLRKNKRG
jgi:hypothetical protein